MLRSLCAMDSPKVRLVDSLLRNGGANVPIAGNHFKARGLAPLRMDKDGSIILDPALALKPKTLRVRISDNGKITGASNLPTQSDVDESAIEKSIQLARDSLFEEEVFHEMSMETRQLLAYGVELRNSVIQLAAPGPSDRSKHRKILIDCIARDDNIPLGQDGSQDWLAQNIAEFLRLLLTHEHHMRLHRRSQIPPPLTQHKRQQSTPPLLRTLLSISSHLDAIDSLHAYLNVVARTLKSAGLELALEASRETSWVKLTDIIKESHRKDLSAIDQLLQTFTRPFEGTTALSLPSSNGAQSEHITVSTRTYIGQPHFGTEHKLTLPPSLISVLNLSNDQQRQFKMSSTEDVKSYLDWNLSLDISHTVLSKEYPGRTVIKSKDPRVCILSNGSKKGSHKEYAVSIQLENGILKATASNNMHLVTGAIAESFVWNGSPGHPSLREKVKSWVDRYP